MALKQQIKRLAIGSGLLLGPHLPTPALRRYFCHHCVPYLLDPVLLPKTLVKRPARRVGVKVLCDPHTYVHRSYYWCGTFFEEEVEAYLLREVKAGDSVIDVGMNVGHIAIPAAALVGAQGRVIAFEPNVGLAHQVQALAREHGFSQLQIHTVGLGHQAGRFTLRMEPEHAGSATLRDTILEGFTLSIDVEVKIGDEALRHEHLPGRVFLKLDVEGCEINALLGLRETLLRVDDAIIEVSPEWLGSDGVAELFGLMKNAGMDAFDVDVSGQARRELRPSEIKSQRNVFFVRNRC